MNDELVKRLRNTPNWMREGYKHWKDNVQTYDRAPFEAADRIEALSAAHSAALVRERDANAKAMQRLRRAEALTAERDVLAAKLELEKALTDGAHQRARAAEAALAKADELAGARWGIGGVSHMTVTRTHTEHRAADRLGLVSVWRGYATPEQAARIEAERAEIEAAIADEVARMKGDRG